MANSSISATEGSGKNIATYSFSESTTKELQRVSINNSSGTEVGTAASPLGANISQVNSTTIDSNSGNKSAGTLRVVIATDQPALSNKLLVTPDAGSTVNLVPATSGGLSVFHLASAGSTNATNVKASAGQLYGYMISNTSAAYSYLAFHNTAGTPTAGASIFFKIGIPSGGAANVSFEQGLAFGTGIGITTVTGAADSNNTAVAANDLIINLWYK